MRKITWATSILLMTGLLLGLACPALAQQSVIKETHLVGWNGTEWKRLARGSLFAPAVLSATIGGGYGDTGITLSSAGVIQADGNLTIGASKFTVAAATGNSSVAGTLAVYGALTATTDATVTNANDNIAASTTATYYGKTVFLTHATGGTVTLPDAATVPAGTWIRFVLMGDDNLAVTFQESGTDDLIAPNNATADSVTFGAGHRIAATVKFLCNGTNWIVINENAGCTMTVTDAA